MSDIKKIPNNEISLYVDICSKAYPSFGLNTQDDKEKLTTRYCKLQDESPNSRIVGLYRDQMLMGGMILYDFKMNMLGEEMDACGVGTLAVELLHKKEKVAKDMIYQFLETYRNNCVNMAILYPFRPDFYKKMGFGYGRKMNQYRIKPQSFPASASKEKLRYLTTDDAMGMYDCYEQVYMKTHGMIKSTLTYFENIFKNPKLRIIGYCDDNQIKGYMIFSFKEDKDNFLDNDINIIKLVYQSKEIVQSFYTFLNSQSDQVRYVYFNTLDDNFHHVLFDPRNDSRNMIPSVYHESNTQGVGLMYRVINLEGIINNLKNHCFNGINCRVKLNVTDNFLTENNKPLIVHFESGYPLIKEEGYDVEVSMNVADFSSLIMGVIRFIDLYNYNLAEISNLEYIPIVNKLFMADEKPVCMTDF